MKRTMLVVGAVLLFGVFAVSCGGAVGENSESGGERMASEGTERESEREEPTPVEIVRLSQRTTVEAGSARVAMTMTYPASEGMPEFSMEMRGVQDFTTGDGDFTLAMPFMPTGGEVEHLVVDNVMYQRYPEDLRAQMPFLPPEKEWVATDLEEQYEEQYGMSLQEMQSSASQTPADQLSYLRSVGSVERIGSEKIDGAQTTRYRAVVDLNRELEALDGEEELTRMYRDLEEQLGTDEFPTEVWIDADGLVRRQLMEVPLPDFTSVEGADGETTAQQLPEGEMTMTVTYGDFGVPVAVEAPPAEAVIPQEEFEALVQGQGA